jgi:hypothetical protein
MIEYKLHTLYTVFVLCLKGLVVVEVSATNVNHDTLSPPPLEQLEDGCETGGGGRDANGEVDARHTGHGG